MADQDFESSRAHFEHEISDMIRRDNGCTTYFTWEGGTDHVSLSVHTYNPYHKQKFLLVREREECGASWELRHEAYFKCLGKVARYVQSRRTIEAAYLVEWNIKSCNESIKRSYFNGKNVREVLDKLYEVNDEDTLIIYKIEMLPEA